MTEIKIFDVLAMGIRNLLRRKTRTILTVLGVVVGSTAIVIMLSLGIGMNEKQQRTIENMGDLTMIDLRSYVGKPVNGDQNNWQSFENKLDDELIATVRKMDGVLAVTPYVELYNGFKIKSGKKYEMQWAQLCGVDSSFIPYMKLEVTNGYLPVNKDQSFILFGADTIYEFYNPKKPIRDWYKEFYNEDGTRKPPKVDVVTDGIVMETFSYGGYWDNNGNYIQNSGNFRPVKYTFDSIGVMKMNQTNYETSYYTYVDLNTALDLQKEVEKMNKVKSSDSQVGKYNTIKIKVKDIRTAEKIQNELSKIGITTYGLSDIRKEMQSTQMTMQMILGGIGAMSLIVAAIGIANTMFMSIYERTKEIGVMKVLGCPLFGIKLMFLFEASIIGFFGGIMGVAISSAGSYAMNNVDFISKALGNIGGSNNYYYGAIDDGAISVIPFWLIIMAIIFSTIIGLLSGFLPAQRATKISALEAIRNE